MLILSPEERAQLWWSAFATREPEEREQRLTVLAKAAVEELRSEFDLYGDYEDAFIETFVVLDQSNELLDDDMLRSYQALGTDQPGAGRRFFSLVIARLGALAQSLLPVRARATELYALWREHIGEGEPMLTVAEVAERYGVVPQTVYKWIEKGKLPAQRSPGGGRTRIFARDLATNEVGARLARLAVDETDLTIGPLVQKLEVRGELPYAKALAAIESGDVPPLPRRRQRPELLALLNEEDGAPTDEELALYRDDTPRARRRPFTPTDRQ